MFYNTSNMAVSHSIFADPKWDVFREGNGNINLERFKGILESVLGNNPIELSPAIDKDGIYQQSYDYSHALPGFRGYCDSVFKTHSLLAVRIDDCSDDPDASYSHSILSQDIISLTLENKVTIYALYDPHGKTLISPVTPALGLKDLNGNNGKEFVYAETFPVDYQALWEEKTTSPVVFMGGIPDSDFTQGWPLDSSGVPMRYHARVRVVEKDNLYVFFPKRAVKPRVGQVCEGVVLSRPEKGSTGTSDVDNFQNHPLGFVKKPILLSEASVESSYPTSHLSTNYALKDYFKDSPNHLRIIAKLEPFNDDIETVYGDGMCAWVIRSTNPNTQESEYQAFYIEL